MHYRLVLLVSFLVSGVICKFNFTGVASHDFRSSVFTREEFKYFWHVSTSSIVRQTTSKNGFDILGVYMFYDKAADSLFVGVECDGVCGEADPKKYDLDNFCGGEHFGLLMWPNPPSSYEPKSSYPHYFFPTIVASVPHSKCIEDSAVFPLKPNEITSLCSWPISVRSRCTSEQRAALDMYNMLLDEQNPVGTVNILQTPTQNYPSLEFSIPNFSQLPGFDGTVNRLVFRFALGSPLDGHGEDFAPQDGVSDWTFPTSS